MPIIKAMKVKSILFVSLVAFIISSCVSKQHLFILSGQSNMAGLRPEESFTPTIESEFGEENVIVIKDALGGQPIRRWYKNWKPLVGDEPKAQPDL